VDTTRFIRPVTNEMLNLVYRTFHFLSKKHISNLEVDVEWLNENNESVLIAELLKLRKLNLKYIFFPFILDFLERRIRSFIIIKRKEKQTHLIKKVFHLFQEVIIFFNFEQNYPFL